MANDAHHLVITGKVQGVGFRPFIYRHARALNLSGWVRNCTGQVEIHIEGETALVEQFSHDLVSAAPAISDPHIVSLKHIKAEGFNDFRILASDASENPQIHIPTDFFTCPDCLAELQTRLNAAITTLSLIVLNAAHATR